MTQTTFSLTGTVLLPNAQVREATIYLNHGQIDRVSPGRDLAADLVTQGIIAPGFIDLQVNGAFGVDFTRDSTAIPSVAERLPESGVTGFLPTIITSDFSAYPARLREVAAAMQHNRGARVLGAHLEGPYMNPIRKGAHPTVYIRQINVDEIRAWADPTVVRIVTLAPELDGALEAVRALCQAGIRVSAGHSDATFAQAMAGFQAGISWGTHLYNAMSPLQHREPGLMGALLLSTVPCGLIVDGVHSHPAMVQLAWKSKGAERITLITDCIAAMGMPIGRYQLGAHNVIVDQTSARLEDGTLAGSTLTMDQAVRNMMAFSGCNLADAICMASTTPARLLGLDHKGSIAPGCDADLVVLSTENEVTHTFVGGRLAYER